MRVSGKDLGTLMKEQIFDPLGMNDTGFFLPESEIPNLADLHHVGKEAVSYTHLTLPTIYSV